MLGTDSVLNGLDYPEGNKKNTEKNNKREKVLEMLVSMITALYMLVRVAEQLGIRWMGQTDSLPYVVSQPLPWQVHSVSQSRKGSKADECEGQRRNSLGVYRKTSTSSNGQPAPTTSPCVEKAASTIQHQYRKYQQRKHKDGE